MHTTYTIHATRTHTYTNTETTRYYLALYTVLCIHALRNVVARYVAETDPLHDLWYSGIDQAGQAALPTDSVPLGELLPAGHGAVMGEAATPFCQEEVTVPGVGTLLFSGELQGVVHGMAGYECRDSAGDYRNRYFSSSEGMTDTVEASQAGVMTEPATQDDSEDPCPRSVLVEREVAVDRESVDSAPTAMVMQSVALDEAAEATYMTARWALLKDAYLDEAADREWSEAVVTRGELFGSMALYAEWRKARTARLLRMVRLTASKGRAALRAGNGDGYRAAHDLLTKVVTVTGQRYKAAVNGIVAKGKASGKSEQQWDWFALYLTREQFTSVKDAVTYERNRLSIAFRARQETAPVKAAVKAAPAPVKDGPMQGPAYDTRLAGRDSYSLHVASVVYPEWFR